MLLKLWIAAIALQAIALTIGIARKAPLSWVLWASVFEATDLLLFGCYHYRRLGIAVWYMRLWCFQQVSSTVLIANMTRYIVRPTEMLVMCSIGCGTCAFCVIGFTRLYPNSPIEPVMLLCGVSALCMGLISIVTCMGRFTVSAAIISGYCLGYAFLSLIGNEILKAPGLGRAWSLLDIFAFTSWAVAYMLSKWDKMAI